MWIPAHLYVLLLQEHPLLRESAGILQDAWWENRKGKQTSSSDHFIFFFFFFCCFMGRGMTTWRIIPSLGPNLSKWGHNRWQNSDSKQQQSVPSSQRGYLGLCCWKHEALIAVKSLAQKSSFSVAHTGKFMSFPVLKIRLALVLAAKGAPILILTWSNWLYITLESQRSCTWWHFPALQCARCYI